MILKEIKKRERQLQRIIKKETANLERYKKAMRLQVNKWFKENE